MFPHKVPFILSSAYDHTYAVTYVLIFIQYLQKLLRVTQVALDFSKSSLHIQKTES